MPNKIIHIKDNFKMTDSISDLDNILEIVDNLNIEKYDIDISNVFFTVNDNITVIDNYFFINTELIVNDNITVIDNFISEENYIFAFDNITVIDNFISQSALNYSFTDNLSYIEYWCDSNDATNGIITFPNINFIVINDLIYNTANLEYYKFTIDDNFNFFIGNKYNNKFESTPTFSEGALITKTNCLVFSNIDGEIINNNIYLSEGIHQLQYKFKNTACQLNLELVVNNKFFFENGKLYEYNDNDLYKAKLIRNHIIHSEKSNVLEDSVILSF